MTLRNRHDRTHDHDGLLDITDVDVDAFEGVIDRTSLTDVLTGLLAIAAPTVRSFNVQAVLKRTMQWQRVDAMITINATIGTASKDTYPGRFTLSAAKKQTASRTFTIDARVA